jgi:hypothetical protein
MSCGGALWRAIRDNPNAPPSTSLLSPAADTLGPNGLHRPLGPLAGPNGMRCMPLWAKPASASVSFKQISPLLFFYFLYFLFLVCSLNLNLNLVSIYANLCNSVDYDKLYILIMTSVLLHLIFYFLAMLRLNPLFG